jgi:GNAT superfamily N-acetyltransferase
VPKHPGLDVQPLTPDRWKDLERLFGERGATSGCWCMWWRKSAKEWDRDAGEPNRRAFRVVAQQGPPPGLLAYGDGVPIGWCAIAPRQAFPRLNGSTKLKPVDDAPVWSIVCFYIDRNQRGTGVASVLLDKAVAWARTHGATLVEGYPVDSGAARRSNAEMFTGTVGMFDDAGFAEVARRGGRPIVRKKLPAARTRSRTR